MNALKKIPFFLPLLAVFFCLHGSAENFGSLTVREVAVTGISVLIAIVIFFGAVWLFVKNMLFAALISFFISIWFFFFGAIHDFVRGVSFLKRISSYTVIIPLLIIATFLWIIYLAKNRQGWIKLCLYLNILLLLYCVIDLGRLSYKAATVNTAANETAFDYSAVKQKPDVFLLLFDGYPGQKSLADSFHFNNQQLYDFLAADSFRSLRVSSNYNLTLFSMSSLLNMKYLKKDFDPDAVAQPDFQKRQNEINDAAVFSVFQKMGYEVKNNSIFDVKDKPGVFDVNGFILGHNQLLTDKIILNRINRDFGTKLPKAIIKLIPFLKDQTAEAHKEDNLIIAQRLENITAEKEDKPVFCYSHFLLPHGPYYFDSTGKRTDPAVNTAPLAWMNRDNFISYLKYGNSVAEKMISNIRQKKPGAIIIFMSDHGFREYLEDNSVQPCHFNNICNIFFPNGRYGSSDQGITNVNLFRYLFNTQFGQQFRYLPDSSLALKLK